MNRLKNTFSFNRIYSAPINLVWRAYTEPELISQWWSPQGFETEIVNYNFKVGGVWEYIMRMPNGMEFIADGKYIEIKEKNRILSEANFKPKTEGVKLEILFQEHTNGTEFTLTVIHTSEAHKQEQEKMGVAVGWEAALDRLSELLWNIA